MWRVQIPVSLDNFQFILSFQPHYVPGIDSTVKRYEYQEIVLGSRVRPTRKAGDLITICEPSVWPMFDRRHLTTLCASTVQLHFSSLQAQLKLCQGSYKTVLPLNLLSTFQRINTTKIHVPK
jgi:hypothetical protein